MAIDDPLDALKQHYRTEDSSRSPIAKNVAQGLRLLPLPFPFDKLLTLVWERLKKDDGERADLMMKTLHEELQRNQVKMAELWAKLDEAEREKRPEAIVELTVDGVRKAQVTRALERIQRIALILANAAMIPVLDADDVEEMTRIAMNLSDGDVAVLRELVRTQGNRVRGGRIDRYQAHQAWEHAKFAVSEVESACRKLESFGLVSSIAAPNNLNILADFQTRFALLNKGLRFIDFIHTEA